ncbi:Gfo/Idh/MocA family protein [Microbacterium sp. NPDC058389]|uniref:Gfo/Idh/MocA family protein n=1 Tax=Microbacterium sp. NPDC058389 TaxID=3346475 RepID=UPI003647905B
MVKELSVALIGGGFMGRAHSLAYAVAPIGADLGVTVARRVLVDVDPARAAEAAQALGWQETATNWRDVISRDDIDIIDICTPPQFHEEIALAAIAAGKHVFCEKPITNDVDGALAMRDAAREANVVAQVGFNYRHSAAIAYTKQLLDAGELGRPLAFRASYLQDGAFWADPARWRAKKSTGGSGTVGDIGSHIIEVAEHLFGDIRRVAARVRARDMDAGWQDDQARIDEDLVDDAGVWLAEFANGAIGTFSVSSFASGRSNRFYFELDATRAAVEFNWNHRDEFRVSFVDERPQLRGFRTVPISTAHPTGWWHIPGIGAGYIETSGQQFRSFLESIVSGRPADPDFGAAAHVQQVVEAVLEAAAADCWVEVPRRDAAR